MFWRSVVGKLAVTILLLVSFVLFILTVLLLQFFEKFHVQEAEKAMLQNATKVSYIVEQHDGEELIYEMTERIKDPSSRVLIVFKDDTYWLSDSTNQKLLDVDEGWYINNEEINKVLKDHQTIHKQTMLPNKNEEIMFVGIPVEHNNGAIFIYQSLNTIEQTKAETTRIVFLSAGIAIFLTTIFAFFLSTRITSPLIKMREAAIDLTKGEFNTKVPILTHDEIGELAIVFNKMGKQLNFHINALRQEKEQLSRIVLSMADGVITLKRNGEMTIVNPPAKKFIEDWFFENNITIEKNNYQMPDELNLYFDQVIQGEKEILQELSLQGRNWVMIMTPLYDQTEVRGAVAVVRDMTEERRLDKLRKDFIANVSHELRTPIALLQCYSEAIVDDIAETKEDKNELAQIIYEESLRMGRLVNELLDMSRMEAGHIQLNKELVDVNSFVARIYKKFKGNASEHGIDLILHQQNENHLVSIDVDRIEQVFTNLIDNAISHTDEGGKVEIVIDCRDNQFSVDIIDTGKGIAEEDLPFVFERFYKADKSRKRKKKGTGLGLAIAKNIVEAHQGTITVKSKLNYGTSFSFILPNSSK